MKLFSYIVANDYGLSPNPFWDRMTMALSKPAIRRAAEVGDWIIGTGSKSDAPIGSRYFRDFATNIYEKEA